MKAMVLAAGIGTRLRPLTQTVPKCLLPLADRPLLEWTFDWLHKCSITECVINLHYLSDQVKDFVGDGSRFGLRVHCSYEPKLLGTAGAVKKVADFFDRPFYVIYSDNFSQWDLGILRTAFEKQDADMTVAVHWRKDVTQSGMIEFDGEARVRRLVEKPRTEQVTSHYVSAGFFYLAPGVLRYIAENTFCDFGFDLFPKMLRAGKRIFAVPMDEPIIGIDTIEAYKLANRLAIEIRQRK